jgi:hypothetical protein
MASSILRPVPPSKAVAALKSILGKPLFWVLISARAPSRPIPPPAKGARDRVTVTYSKIQFHWGDTWLGDILSGGAVKPVPRNTLEMERR